MKLKKRAAFPLATLSRMQLYIGEEMVECYEAGLITWGQMLRSLVMRSVAERRRRRPS